MQTITDEQLASVTGGAALDPNVPLNLENRVLQQCGPQLDAYSAARQKLASNPSDSRAELDSVAKGRSLGLCSTNAGFDPPAAWRSATTGGSR
ncbi:MAG TPA: hypothetical protein VGF94_06245 [Kofleriaceae bacterium]|jgi:bacteriocin-like protein